MARLHIICGNCGAIATDNNMMSYEINPEGICDEDGNERPSATICCHNCSTLHSLEDSMRERVRKMRAGG